MSVRINILTALLTLSLTTGCSLHQGSPTVIGNHYFYVGDSDCTGYTRKTTMLIHCFKSNGEYTGLRSSMSSEQLHMYRHNEELEHSRRLMQDQQMLRSNLR